MALHKKRLIVQNLSVADCGKPQPNRSCLPRSNTLFYFLCKAIPIASIANWESNLTA